MKKLNTHSDKMCKDTSSFLFKKHECEFRKEAGGLNVTVQLYGRTIKSCPAQCLDRRHIVFRDS